MTIGAISFQPYVYHVNAISPASMNRLSRISDDVLDKKTDFSGLAQAENENPLKMGQTLNFQDMIEMQMQRGRNNAARVMRPAQSAQEETGAAEQAESAAAKFDRMNAVQTQPANESDSGNAQMDVQTAGAKEGMGSDISNFRMQQAINAYEMFMTA